MSDKWTKGPWTVGMEDGVTCHAAERNPGWFVVSAPYPPFAFGQGIAVFASEADATVAAAAPDMAEALEAFVTFHQGHVLPPELVHAMEAARAALAKARGTQ